MSVYFRVSYLEIYNDIARDLLSCLPDSTSTYSKQKPAVPPSTSSLSVCEVCESFESIKLANDVFMLKLMICS